MLTHEVLWYVARDYEVCVVNKNVFISTLKKVQNSCV